MAAAAVLALIGIAAALVLRHRRHVRAVATWRDRGPAALEGALAVGARLGGPMSDETARVQLVSDVGQIAQSFDALAAHAPDAAAGTAATAVATRLRSSLFDLESAELLGGTPAPDAELVAALSDFQTRLDDVLRQ